MAAVTYTFGINAQEITINNNNIETNIAFFNNYKPYARFYYDIIKDGRAATPIQNFEQKMNDKGFPLPEFPVEDRRHPTTNALESHIEALERMMDSSMPEDIDIYKNILKTSTFNNTKVLTATEIVFLESGLGAEKVCINSIKKVATIATLLDPASTVAYDIFYPLVNNNTISFDANFMNAMGFQNMLWSQTRTDANTVNVNITYANQTRVTGNINSNITINPFNLSGFTNYMIGNNDKNISINNTDVDTDTFVKLIEQKELGDVAQVWMYFAFIMINSLNAATAAAGAAGAAVAAGAATINGIFSTIFAAVADSLGYPKNTPDINAAFNSANSVNVAGYTLAAAAAAAAAGPLSEVDTKTFIKNITFSGNYQTKICAIITVAAIVSRNPNIIFNIAISQFKLYTIMNTVDSVVYYMCEVLKIPCVNTGSRKQLSKHCMTIEAYVPVETNYPLKLTNLLHSYYHTILSHNVAIKFGLSKILLDRNLITFFYINTFKIVDLVPIQRILQETVEDPIRQLIGYIDSYSTNLTSKYDEQLLLADPNITNDDVMEIYNAACIEMDQFLVEDILTKLPNGKYIVNNINVNISRTAAGEVERINLYEFVIPKRSNRKLDVTTEQIAEYNSRQADEGLAKKSERNETRQVNKSKKQLKGGAKDLLDINRNKAHNLDINRNIAHRTNAKMISMANSRKPLTNTIKENLFTLNKQTVKNLQKQVKSQQRPNFKKVLKIHNVLYYFELEEQYVAGHTQVVSYYESCILFYIGLKIKIIENLPNYIQQKQLAVLYDSYCKQINILPPVPNNSIAHIMASIAKYDDDTILSIGKRLSQYIYLFKEDNELKQFILSTKIDCQLLVFQSRNLDNVTKIMTRLPIELSAQIMIRLPIELSAQIMIRLPIDNQNEIWDKIPRENEEPILQGITQYMRTLVPEQQLQIFVQLLPIISAQIMTRLLSIEVSAQIMINLPIDNQTEIWNKIPRENEEPILQGIRDIASSVSEEQKQQILVRLSPIISANLSPEIGAHIIISRPDIQDQVWMYLSQEKELPILQQIDKQLPPKKFKDLSYVIQEAMIKAKGASSPRGTDFNLSPAGTPQQTQEFENNNNLSINDFVVEGFGFGLKSHKKNKLRRRRTYKRGKEEQSLPTHKRRHKKPKHRRSRKLDPRAEIRRKLLLK